MHMISFLFSTADYKNRMNCFISKPLLYAIFFLFPFFGFAQIGINTDDVDFSAILEIESIDKGVLLPRLDQDQMNGISTPVNGLMIYCTNCCQDGAGTVGSLFYYNSMEWKSLVSDCAVIVDAPLCTQIDITIENATGGNHMSAADTPALLIDNNTDGRKNNDYKMHDSTQDQVRVQFPSFELPVGYSVELYFEYNDGARSIGIKADFINNGSTYQSIDTRGASPTLPAGATIVAEGGGVFKLTYMLQQATDELFITAIGGQHPWLYEIRVLDQSNMPITMQASCP